MRSLLAACSLLFLLPFSARATALPYLSEIAWAGSSASLADEWLEICAAPGSDLSGWSIEGAAASPIVLADGSLVPTAGAFLVANYAADDARSTLAAAPDLVTTAVSLSNSALATVLRDASGAVIDAAGDGGIPPAGTSGAAKASMERVDAATWATATMAIGFDDGAPELGSPGTCAALDVTDTESRAPEESASATEPIAAPEPPVEEPAPPREEPIAAVRVSEIYPSPLSGEREWLELANRSNVGEFLDGWAVEDARGTKTALAGLLLPWARIVIEAPKGSLNNDGDVVTLRDARGRAVDRAEYPPIRKGEAYMRVEPRDEFAMTLTPTPGEANVLTEDAAESPAPETPTPAAPNAPPSPGLQNEAKEPFPKQASAPPASQSAARAPQKEALAAPRPQADKTKAAAKPAPASRYKGSSYAATIVVPPGVYAKTRAYVFRNGAVEELRFSKSVTADWTVGDRIAFVAQTKSEGAVSYLLANPNSVRVTGSASATFAAADAWPRDSGGYRFVAEVASVRGDALEVTLGGVEGDVLVPSGTASALKPGDIIRVEGFIAPGPRPRVVLPFTHALRLEKPYAPGDASAPAARLPAWMAAALTGAAGAIGLAAYLRSQRLKRLALTQAPIDDGAWK